MLYARIDGGAVSQYPITESNIRSQNPNTSFPAGQLSPNTMLEFGCYPVTETSAAFDSNTQRPVEGTPVLVDGQWRQVWTVVEEQGLMLWRFKNFSSARVSSRT